VEPAVQEARMLSGLVEYPGLVSLSAQRGLAVVAAAVVLLPGQVMVASVAPVAVMEAEALQAVLPLAQELQGPVVMEPTASSFSPTPRQVGHQNWSPTLILNTQLQYPPTSKPRLLPSPPQLA